MSKNKRGATSDLNHDNWDQDEDEEEAGCFQVATEDEIRRRVIKKAVRRHKPDNSPQSVNVGSNTFAGLGFVARKPTQENTALKSFSFLGNAKNVAEKVNNTSPWASFVPKTVDNGIVDKSNELKLPVDKPVNVTSVAGLHGVPVVPIASVNLPQCHGNAITTLQNPADASCFFETPQQKSHTSLNNGNVGLLPNFPSTSSTANDGGTPATSGGLSKTNKSGRSDKFVKGLDDINTAFLQWVQNHIAEDRLIILSRCFIDYVNHVQALFDEEKKLPLTDGQRRLLEKQEKCLNEVTIARKNTVFKNEENVEAKPLPACPPSNQYMKDLDEKQVPFGGYGGIPTNAAASDGTQIAQLSCKPSLKEPENVKPTLTVNATETPFSFSNVAVNPSVIKAKEEDTEDEPPKVEFTQMMEEGSVYSKRCKVFVKKDDSKEYQDRGIGTLFLKPVGSSARTQLIVRADTCLGNLLVNTLLSQDIPIQKITSKAANTVMLMCIPTPDAKPPPRAVLLRVKTSLEADELIDKLNQHK